MAFFGLFGKKKSKIHPQDDGFDELLSECVNWIFVKGKAELSYGGLDIDAVEFPDTVKSAFIQYLIGSALELGRLGSVTHDVSAWSTSIMGRVVSAFFAGEVSDERALIEFSRSQGTITNPYSVFALLGREAAQEVIEARKRNSTQDEWIVASELKFLKLILALAV